MMQTWSVNHCQRYFDQSQDWAAVHPLSHPLLLSYLCLTCGSKCCCTSLCAGHARQTFLAIANIVQCIVELTQKKPNKEINRRQRAIFLDVPNSRRTWDDYHEKGMQPIIFAHGFDFANNFEPTNSLNSQPMFYPWNLGKRFPLSNRGSSWY